MKIIDDFLSIPDFDKLSQYLCGPNFQWYLQPTIVNNREGLDQYQFTHCFYNRNIFAFIHFFVSIYLASPSL